MLVRGLSTSRLYPSILDIDNEIYNSDFVYLQKDIEHWIKSDGFCVSYLKCNDLNGSHINAYASILFISDLQYMQLINGFISELDLVPINYNSCVSVCHVYFASIFSKVKGGADRVCSELRKYVSSLDDWNRRFGNIVCIICTEKGHRYSARDGFHHTGMMYKNKYHIVQQKVSRWVDREDDPHNYKHYHHPDTNLNMGTFI